MTIPQSGGALRQKAENTRAITLHRTVMLKGLGGSNPKGTHSVIVGGEAGPMFRQTNLAWLENIPQGCEA
jgi:protein gp37